MINVEVQTGGRGPFGVDLTFQRMSKMMNRKPLAVSWDRTWKSQRPKRCAKHLPISVPCQTLSHTKRIIFCFTPVPILSPYLDQGCPNFPCWHKLLLLLSDDGALRKNISQRGVRDAIRQRANEYFPRQRRANGGPSKSNSGSLLIIDDWSLILLSDSWCLCLVRRCMLTASKVKKETSRKKASSTGMRHRTLLVVNLGFPSQQVQKLGLDYFELSDLIVLETL